MPPLPLSIAALASAPLACVAASGVGFGGSSLMGAGLVGLAALTIISERWRRRSAFDAAEQGIADAGADSPAANGSD